MTELIQEASDKITGAVGDKISETIDEILTNTVYRLFYYLSIGLCKIIYYLDSMFKTFSGQTTVTYDGDESFLINVFFNNHTITNAYWGMALIGIVFAFAFAIVAVIRKMGDLRDKDQRSLGQILGSLAKTILLILSMNFIIMVVLNTTNILMQQITYVFDNADILDKKNEITFTEEELATMGRALNTLGNYSLNPSPDNLYNVNACFNAMRADLDYLRRQDVFDFYYETKDRDGHVIQTWQSVLQSIANSADLRQDLKVDVYHESVQKAITDGMKELKNNPNLKPLASYKRTYSAKAQTVPMDRYLFLICTFDGAKNETWNNKPELTDGLRGPYYYGDKDIYDFDQITKDFSINFAHFDYLILWCMTIALIWDFGVILFSCVARIFNMLLLYLIAPLVFAVEPLDDGAKRKQWTTAFLVQSLAIFATVVAMRVLMIFIPIVVGGRLVLFDNIILNTFGKVILLLGGFEVVKKSSGIITGILADSAGWQSIQASDMSHRGGMLTGGMKGLIGMGTVGALTTGFHAITGNTDALGKDVSSGASKIFNASGANELLNNDGGGSGASASLPPNMRK